MPREIEIFFNVQMITFYCVHQKGIINLWNYLLKGERENIISSYIA